MHRRQFMHSVSLSLLGGAAATPAFAGEHATRARGAVVVRKGEDRFGEDIRIGPESPNRLKVSAVDTAGGLAVFEFESAGRGGPSLHVHHEQEEWFFIREGRYLFRVGDTEYRLGPGDSILAPRGIPHTWAHLDPGVGRLLYLVQPAGLMESFFRARAASQGRRTEAETRRLHEAHGMTWLGPGIVV